MPAPTRPTDLEAAFNAGLWAPHLPKEFGGMGLDFLAHAYMNEVLAYGVGAASLFGVVAPNSGNQSILVKYGTEEQKEKWLLPLIAGEMESGFSMTEPANAGSDPRSLTTSAVRDGDEWVINGHKWFTSNGIDADFFIVMARVAESDEAAKRREGTMAQFIVPAATRGVNIVRGVGVWGSPTSDHARSSTRTCASRGTASSARSVTATRPLRTASAQGASSIA